MIQNYGYSAGIENFEFEKELISKISEYAFDNYKDVLIHIIPYNMSVSYQPLLIDGKSVFSNIDDVKTVPSELEYYYNMGAANRAVGYYFTNIDMKNNNRNDSKKFVYNFTNYNTFF